MGRGVLIGLLFEPVSYRGKRRRREGVNVKKIKGGKESERTAPEAILVTHDGRFSSDPQ